MNGDYTKVPLRADERWTSAPMQQARVLLDHEWNLNLAATARIRADEIVDVIGPAGFPSGSSAFEVLAVTISGAQTDLSIGAGHGWVGGLEPYAPLPFDYSTQDEIAALPASGRAFVYLDVFDEHVQPAEDPEELVDPALAPIDSAARTRVGWRVRVAATPNVVTCAEAMAGLNLAAISDGVADIFRTTPATTPDPCAPPGDPLGLIPDGLLHVEVLDAGDASTARIAWSFDDGASAVDIQSVAGNRITLAPSISVKFANNDLIEVSWLARRADRLDHGPLYTVTAVTPGAGGDVLMLDRAVTTVTGGEAGLCVRRWDGEVVGASADQIANLRGVDLGVRFRLTGNQLVPGDWWGSRVRESAPQPVEVRTGAPPDGIRHAFCPLAMVDLTAGTVLEDCRPMFDPLVGREEGSACTVIVQPGDDLQAAFDSLPDTGGEVCLAAGLFLVRATVKVFGRRRVGLTGVGSPSIVRALGTEAAITFDHCADVEIRSVRVEGGRAAAPGDPHLDGALTFLGCDGVRVTDCQVTCPDSLGRAQACIGVRAADDGTTSARITIDHNDVLVGAWQVGVLVVDAASVSVDHNHVRLGPLKERIDRLGHDPTFIRNFTNLMLDAVTITQPDAARRRAERSLGASDVQAVGGKLLEPAAQAFVEWADPDRLQRFTSPRQAMTKFVRTMANRRVEELSPGIRRVISRAARELHVALQGIVVGGTNVGSVRVTDNLVDDTIQGIHVGVSNPKAEGRELVGEVIISRNIVHSAVPIAHDRERHAVFVGNARSVHVIDTVATLTRGADKFVEGRGTPVDAIRVFGVLGPFLVVRHTSADGFRVGVRVSPVSPEPSPKQRMWLVAETVAAGIGATGVNVAPGIDLERNFP